MLTATYYDLTIIYNVRTPGPYINFIYNHIDIIKNDMNLYFWIKYKKLYITCCMACVNHDWCKMYKYKKDYGYLTTFLCKKCHDQLKYKYSFKNL